MSAARDAQRKSAVIKNNQTKANDTGSADVQVAILTDRINYLSEHLQTHKKRLPQPPRPARHGRQAP